jgi:hypothetical protein
MEIYLLRESYEVLEGEAEFSEGCVRGEPRWFSNAVLVLEVVQGVLMMSSSSICSSK